MSAYCRVGNPRGERRRQPAQSRDQLGHDEDADPQGIRLGAEGPHLLRPQLFDVAFGQRRGIEKDPHHFSSRSARTSSLRLKLPRESRVRGGFFQAGIAALTGTMSATGRPLRYTRTVSPSSTASKKVLAWFL